MAFAADGRARRGVRDRPGRARHRRRRRAERNVPGRPADDWRDRGNQVHVPRTGLRPAWSQQRGDGPFSRGSARFKEPRCLRQGDVLGARAADPRAAAPRPPDFDRRRLQSQIAEPPRTTFTACSTTRTSWISMFSRWWRLVGGAPGSSQDALSSAHFTLGGDGSPASTRVVASFLNPICSLAPCRHRLAHMPLLLNAPSSLLNPESDSLRVSSSRRW
jgi:hypothetical protein